MKNAAFFFSVIATQRLKKQRGKQKPASLGGLTSVISVARLISANKTGVHFKLSPIKAAAKHSEFRVPFPSILKLETH